jgi:hypothetical protein
VAHDVRPDRLDSAMAETVGPSNSDRLDILTFNRSSAPKIFASVDRLEKVLGLPHGSFERLVDVDDDWSFILKIHALMEASLTMLLAERIGGDRLPDSVILVDALSHLEMSRRTHLGKVDLAFALGLLDENERRLLRKMSELRNTFVHQVANVSLSLINYVAAFDSNQRRSFAEALYPPATPHSIAVAIAHPRRSIWFVSLLLLQHLRSQFDNLRVARRAPGTNRADFLAELHELSKDMNSLVQRAKGRSPGTDAPSPFVNKSQQPAFTSPHARNHR